MEKLFTGKEYTQKAQEANTQGQKLYIYTYSQEVEVDVPVYDENGFQTGTKKETAEKEFAKLLIAPSNYYICYKDNYTDGSVNPDYEEEIAQREAQRIAKLSLTAADVERAIYKAKGLDFDDVIALVEQYNEAAPLDAEGNPAGVDIKALKIELKANNFYRGSEWVTTVGAMLGFTPKQLDLFFEDGNYEHLISSTEN